MKKTTIVLSLLLVFAPMVAMAKGHSHKKPAKPATEQQNSLIGEQKVGESISVGNGYAPSEYPRSGYALGTDGLYHFNPARVGRRH